MTQTLYDWPYLNTESFNFEQSYFDLFGLPVSCELDTTQLRQQFMELQRQYHPDRFAAGSDTERRIAVQIASYLNSAHQTLVDPLKRAEYCLQLAGLDTNTETDTKMDPMFLMQQMELRESLEEVASAKDPLQSLDKVRAEIDELIDQTAAQTSELLANDKLESARDGVRRWQFLEKLASEASAIEAQLDDV